MLTVTRWLQAVWVALLAAYAAFVVILSDLSNITAVIPAAIVGLYVVACVGTFWNKPGRG